MPWKIKPTFFSSSHFVWRQRSREKGRQKKTFNYGVFDGSPFVLHILDFLLVQPNPSREKTLNNGCCLRFPERACSLNYVTHENFSKPFAINEKRGKSFAHRSPTDISSRLTHGRRRKKKKTFPSPFFFPKNLTTEIVFLQRRIFYNIKHWHESHTHRS